MEGYATLGNTIGVGDVVPAQQGTLGSGDKTVQGKNKIQTKKSSEHVFNCSEPLPLIVYKSK